MAPSPFSSRQDRKELAAGNYRDKHWQWSALLLASGVGIAIEGAPVQCLPCVYRFSIPMSHSFGGT